jgi:hypothetical protein
VVVEDGPSLNFVYSEAKRVFDFQFDQIDKLDAKAGLLLGAAAITLAVLLQGGLGREGLHNWTAVLLSLAAVSISASAVSAVAALWVRDYTQVPNPRALARKYLRRPVREVKVEVLRSFIKFYFETKDKADCKGAWLNQGGLLLMIGIVLVAAAFIIEVV